MGCWEGGQPDLQDSGQVLPVASGQPGPNANQPPCLSRWVFPRPLNRRAWCHNRSILTPQLLTSTSEQAVRSLEREIWSWRKGKGKRKEGKEKRPGLYFKNIKLKHGSEEIRISGVREPRMYYQSRCKNGFLTAYFAPHSSSNPKAKIHVAGGGRAPTKWKEHRCVKKSWYLRNKY